MRVCFDYQIFSMQEYGGVSRYYCSLSSEISKIKGVEARIVAPFYINSYLRMIGSNLVTGIKVPNLSKSARIRLMANQMCSIPLMAKFSPDIVHETYYLDNTFAPGNAKRILTVNDMIHERFYPKHDPTGELKKKAIKRADHIICISENTRRDLLDLHQLPSCKVSVVYLGIDALPNITDNGPSLGILPYILYVGTRSPYKNFGALVEAYASSTWLRNNFRLICFGGGVFTSSEKEMFKSKSIRECQVQQICGDDSILAACYQNAAVFVYPSLYEGFGLPPLEAMTFNCPVACSNTSSIPEIVGAAGIYFDPSDIESIREAIENVLQSSDLRADLKERGLLRSKLFSWQKCARETTRIYLNVL